MTEHSHGQYQRMIQTQEEGSLALLLSIILQCVTDIQLHISPGEAGAKRQANPTRKAELSRECLARKHLLWARQAGRFLDSEECQILIRIADACGVQVPMDRLRRSLYRLKKEAAR